jgi:hypothetical protein
MSRRSHALSVGRSYVGFAPITGHPIDKTNAFSSTEAANAVLAALTSS